MLVEVAELRAALELSPWTVGDPYVASNPNGMRTVTFGQGAAMLIFGVIERDRLVTVIQLVALAQ